MAELNNIGEKKQFNYTGSIQQITLLPGKYKLEAYGASGGSGYGAGLHTRGSIAGLGGYTSGEIILTQETTLFIYVGGQGRYGNGGNGYSGPIGGWNGGGNGGNSGSGSGGGATDFRLQNGQWNNIDSLKSRILVAGGGGGADNATNESVGREDDGSGGSGGGLTAQGCWINGSYNSIYGGTQNSGGAFGYGTDVTINTDTGGAGGGWYGGKVSNHNNGGAGGGSSYLAGFPGCNIDYLISHQNNIHFENGVLDIGKNNGNGYAIITYIYDIKKYSIILNNENLTCDKTEAYQTEKISVNYNSSNILSRLRGWILSPKIEYTIINKFLITFTMPSYDIIVDIWTEPNRLNSNIYKNIFPEEVINMDFINKSLANTIISTEDIRQDNHNLSVNDFVYLDNDGLYKKALAEDSIKANVVGIVSKIAGPNVFTLMDSGKIPFDHLDYTDTTILYLSDKVPGKAVHYSEITNTIYIPVAVYIEDKIIINLQQGSIGDVLAPYEKEEQSFENYTEQELNDVVNQITNGVK